MSRSKRARGSRFQGDGWGRDAGQLQAGDFSSRPGTDLWRLVLEFLRENAQEGYATACGAAMVVLVPLSIGDCVSDFFEEFGVGL